MMDAAECQHVGLMHHVVPADQVMAKALAVAEELAGKAPLAFRLDKAHICAATQPAFDMTFEAARQIHRQAFDAGEPQSVMETFLSKP
jgi:enoyl-CoA hydratase/carnithine racemase